MREKDISVRIVRRLIEFVPPLALADGVVPCQHWSGASNADGYGIVRIGGREYRAHRAVWTIMTGQIIPKGLVINHLCDIYYPKGDITYRLCCEPSHLHPDTHLANMQHAIESGRKVPLAGEDHWTRRHPDWLYRGVDHPRARAASSDYQILEYRRRYAAGEAASDLAIEAGVGAVTMWHAVTGTNWSHLPGSVPKTGKRGPRTGAAHWARRKPELVLRGAANGAAKYTDEFVADVNRRLAANEGVNAIARATGMSAAQVSRIKNGAARKNC